MRFSTISGILAIAATSASALPISYSHNHVSRNALYERDIAADGYALTAQRRDTISARDWTSYLEARAYVPCPPVQLAVSFFCPSVLTSPKHQLVRCH